MRVLPLKIIFITALLGFLSAPESFAMGAKRITQPQTVKEFKQYTVEQEQEAADGFKAYREKNVINQYPSVKKTLNEALDRLNEAQKNLLNSDPRNPRVGSVSTELALVDSPDANAFIIRPYLTSKFPHQFGYTKDLKPLEIKNYLVINTSALQKLLSSSNGTDKIIGVLAHEFGHSLNAKSVDYLEGWHVNEFGADYHAQVLLKEAQFNPGAIYETLDELLGPNAIQDEKKLKEVASSFFSTHPENELRKTAKRVSLTVDRYQNGWPPEKPLKNQISEDEIKKFSSISKRYQTIPYEWRASERPLNEVLDKIEELRSYWATQQNRVVENQAKFNGLWYELDQHLLHNPNLTNLQKTRIVDLYSGYAAQGQINRDLCNSLFPPIVKEIRIGGRSDLYLSARTQVLESNQWLQSDEYRRSMVAKMKEKLPIHEVKNIEQWHDTSANLSQVIPRGHVAPTLEELIGPQFLFGGDVAKNAKYAKSKKWVETTAEDAKRAIESFFYNGKVSDPFHSLQNLVTGPMSAADRVYVLNRLFGEGILNAGDLNHVARLFLSTREGLEPLVLWKQQEMGPADLKVVSKEMKELAGQIWQNKAQFALGELYLPGDRSFNWDLIFKTLNLDAKTAVTELQGAVSEVLKSPSEMKKVAVALKTLSDHPGEKLLSEDGFFLSQSAMTQELKRPIWLDAATMANFDDRVVKKFDLMDQYFLKRAFYLRPGNLDKATFRDQFKRKLYLRLSAANKPGTKLTKEELSTAIQSVDSELRGLVTPPRGFTSVEEGTVRTLTNWAATHFDDALPYTKDLVAEWISQSNLTQSHKTELLNSIFVEDLGDFGAHWIGEPNSARVSEILKKYDIVLKRFGPSASLSVSERLKFLKNARKVFESELNEIRAMYAQNPVSARTKLTHFISGVWGRQDKLVIQDEEVVQLKKQLVELLSQMHLEPRVEFQALHYLTRDGALKEIDARALQLARTTSDGSDLEVFLKGESGGTWNPKRGEFLSPNTTNAFMERWVEIKMAGKSEIDPVTMNQLAKSVTEFMEASSVRDDVLENLALKTPAATRADLWELEKKKAYRAMFVGNQETQAKMASSVATYVHNLPREDIESIIRHIQLNPGEGISPELRGRLFKHIAGDAGSLSRARALAAGVLDWNDEVEASHKMLGKKIPTDSELANLALDNTEKLLLNLRGDERVPLIDFLLHSGTEPLAESNQYEMRVMRDYLGYEAGSRDENILRAFLDSIPPHEKSVTLSYLIAQKKGVGSTSLSPIFEAFGTPGKKAAQQVSIWKLLGENSKELADFKSGAKPMSKYRFMSIVEKEIKPASREGLKVKRFVNAASIKTGAIVEFQDGKEWFMAVLEPNALSQSQSQFAFGKRFVKNLEKYGVKSEPNLINALMHSLEEQLVRETDARIEAKNMSLMQSKVEKLNRSYHQQMQGFEFEVPKISSAHPPTRSTLTMEIMHGVEFGKLTGEAKVLAGEEKVKGMIRLFFEHGLWDPDRHVGNTLYELGKKNKIQLLDLAQMEQFNHRFGFLPDERSAVAEFLYALSSRDENYLARQAVAMSNGKPLTVPELRELGAKLKTALATDRAPQDQLIDIFKSLSENGVILKDKYSAGILKGMITLNGEEYVSSARFGEIFRVEATKYLKNKKVWMAASLYKNERLNHPGSSAVDCFRRVIRNFSE